MSLRIKTRHLLQALALIPFLMASSCGDDENPSGETVDWDEVTLANAPARGALYSLAFSGSRGLAAGVGTEGSSEAPVNSPYLAAQMSDGTWAPAEGVPLPAGAVLSAVGFASAGEALLAGVASTGFILDERDGWSRHDFPFGGVAFATNPGIVRVAGYSLNNNAVLKSSASDTWIPESVPFPGDGGEHAVTDITSRDGIFFTCGFDDGGDGSPAMPYNVLFRNDGSGWVRIEAPCGGCSNREFRSVAMMPSGALLLGGAVTDFSGGSPDQYRAFMLLYSAAGGWTEIVLPDAGALDRVNDILVAADGDIYLACGVEGSTLVHSAAGGPFERETAFPMARITALAESPDGSIWAAGASFTGAEEESHPGLWKRKG